MVCLFQPHRYTRTRDLLAEFTTAFNDADVLLLTDIYAAGEEPIPGVDGASARRGDPRLRAPRRVLRARARASPPPRGERVRPGDIVLTLGAGDVTAVGPELLGLLEG